MLVRFVAGFPAFREPPAGTGESILAYIIIYLYLHVSGISYICWIILDHAILCDLIPCDFAWFCSRNKNTWIILNSFWHRFWSLLEPAWSILNCLRICLTLFDCFVWLRWWPDQLRRVREDDDGQVSHERKLRAFQSLSCAQPTQLWCTEPVACSSRQQAVSWIATWCLQQNDASKKCSLTLRLLQI